MNAHDANEEKRLANVRPPAWQNPEPAPRYNLVVIGGGTAGLVSASAAAQLGGRVALVERHLLGGDCLNVGCVPSKALLRAARLAAEMRGAATLGMKASGDVAADFGAVMERMRKLRARISEHDSAQRLKGLGVDVFLGGARFTGPRAIEVEGRTLHFRRCVIATGSRAAAAPIAGLSETGYLTNETVFDLTARPKSLVVVGGGPLGCEMAQAFARLGSEVTIVQKEPQFLPGEERDAAQILSEALARDGIRIWLNTEVTRVARANGGKTLRLRSEGRESDVTAEEILVGLGRAPNVEGLNLEAAGVRYDTLAGVHVDDRLRTTNPAVYAAGDVALPHRFTHTADASARIVVQNALFMGRKKLSALTIPWCTYTDPEIAHVGIYVREANDRRIPVKTFTIPMHQVDRAILDGEEEGFVKIHVREGTDRILGATVVARHAGEMINEITLAMVAGAGLGTVAKVIHSYPTQAEAIRKAADAYLRSRLTPTLRKLTSRWLAWTR
jgi:pyruvate/2-oxoglutarate dehydrogenase complex dihydrolipoamide dehydrogenase (E3) component